MKKIFFLIILALQVSFVFSQDDKYDAVYNTLTKTYTLNSDGSIDYHYSKEMKLQTYRAFHNLYGETFIVYNPAFQSLKVNKVVTTMADGKKVNAPSNAYNEVLPGWAANAPAYNGLREMVVTHPGTERNAILEIDYNIHTNKGAFPALNGIEVLTESEPVKDLTLKVRVPENVKLNYRLINDVKEPVVSKEGNYQVYTWNVKNVPAYSTEESQKGWNELYPRVIFSTAKDRQSVYSSFLSQQAFSFAADDDMKKLISSVLAGNKEPSDVILKLQEKVVNDVRTWTIPLQCTGYTCRNASATYKSNGGTVPEKAILLTSLLREAGITAHVAGVIKSANYDPAVGLLQDCEDFIVIAETKELEPMYLSVTKLNSQSLKMSLPEKTIVVLEPGDKVQTIKTDEYSNRIKLTSRFVVNDKNQMEGEVAGTFYNNSTPWYTQLRDQVKMKNVFAGGIAAADLKEVKLITTTSVEGNVRYSALKEKPFRKDSTFYYYTLPAVNNGIDSWGIKLLPKSRITPMEIPSAMEESYDFTMEASNLKLFSTGNDVNIKNKCGSFVYEVKQDGNKLTVKKSIALNKRIISPEDYPAFKDLMDHWNSSKTRELILR